MSDYEAWDPETLEAAGLVLVAFSGGSLDGQTRLLKLPMVEGSTYNKLVPVDETWVLRDGHYELVDE